MSVPSGTTSALIGFCYYNDTGPESAVRLTSVSLDGQAATYIAGSGTASAPTTTFTGLYQVTGFGTGAGKTLSYTVPATGVNFAMSIGVEFRDGTLTFGTTGAATAAASSAASPGPASTSGISNTSGDELVAFYCTKDDFGSVPTVGTGQTKQDETDDTTGRVYYGFSTESATGSADVQTIGAGGTANLPSIAAVAVTTTTNVSFTVAPTYSTVSNTQIKATFTASSGGATYYCALYAPGATAPSAAQLQAGTNAHSAVVTGSTTGSSENHTMTASDSPTFPKYDPYCVINSGTVATTQTTQTTPPTTCGASSNQACQYVTLSSVAVGGIASVATLTYDGQTANFVTGETVTGGTSGAVALVQSDSDGGSTGTLTLWVKSGAFVDNETLTGSVNGVAVVNGTATYLYAANDVLVAPTYVSPAGSSYPLTIGADGTAVYDAVAYDANVGVERATNIKVYDYSAVAYASGDIDWANNKLPPACTGAISTQNLTLNVAMSSIDFDTVCTEPDSETLNSVAVGTLPTGVALNGTTNVLSGTPTVLNTGATVRFVIYNSTGSLAYRDVLFTVANGFTMPDCLSVPTLTSECANDTSNGGAVTVATPGACSNTVGFGFVISQDTAAGADLTAGDTVTLTSSLGPCVVPIPNCLSKTVAQCGAEVADVAPTVTLSRGSGCSANGSTVYSQTPAARSHQDFDSTLSLLCH